MCQNVSKNGVVRLMYGLCAAKLQKILKTSKLFVIFLQILPNKILFVPLQRISKYEDHDS